MTTTPLYARTDAVLRRLVRKAATPQVRKVLARARPEDIAAALRYLTRTERQRVVGLLDDPDRRAEMLALLDADVLLDVVEGLDSHQVVEMLVRMEPDDAADIVEQLPGALRNQVVAIMASENTDEVSSLLRWPSESAGGIMSPVVFCMPQQATCGQAIERVQAQSDDYESLFYVYVVDDDDRLVGVVSLRNLIVHPPQTPLSQCMVRDVISVSPYQDQEEVARYVARYDLLAVPVIDGNRHLLGMVTVDDVLDVVRQEAVEDMMMMAGVSDDLVASGRGVLRQARARAGWLLATLFGGIAASELIGYYESSVAKAAILAGFIPVIMGMGGNVGIQSATLTVRGLALGQVQLGGTLGFIWREARVGIVLGLLYGMLLGGYVLLRHPQALAVGESVGVSVALAIGLASVFGSATPVAMARLGVDPAVATGPLVTTIVDVLSIFIYFSVAGFLLQL